MEAGPTPNIFQHDPLPDPHTYFRLLKILQGGFGRPVVCELTTWLIDDAPSYSAISYTWGAAASLAIITVNTKPMTVRKNCEYVLQQYVHASKAPKSYLWVDAICIEQKGIHEKNHQVSLMTTIYCNAKDVYACVGQHAEDSEYLLKAMKRMRFLLPRIYADLHPAEVGSDQELEGFATQRPTLRSRGIQTWCLLAKSSGMRLRLTRAFLALMMRPYFTRAWILQELYLGQTVSLCCGHSRRPIEQFLAMDILLDIWLKRKQDVQCYLGLDRMHGFVEGSSLTTRMTACLPMRDRFTATWPQRSCLTVAAGGVEPFPLADVLEAMKNFECTDPRDTIYGVLSLVKLDWPNFKAPFPDYNKDSFVLAVEILTKAHYRQFHPRTSHHSMSKVALATRLRTLLRINPDQNAMRTAQAKRTSPTSYNEAASSDDVSELLAYDRLTADTEWYGFQLNSSCQVMHHPDCVGVHCDFDKQHDQSSVEIHNCHGDILSYAPLGTGHGDWFLAYPKFSCGLCTDSRTNLTSINSCSTAGIILKPKADGHYRLIGQVYPVNNSAGCVSFTSPVGDPRSKRFDIYWHAEDLMILEWRYAQFEMSEASHQAIAKWLEQRICFEDGSSYAFGPFDNDCTHD
jgi:hypothetical protein